MAYQNPIFDRRLHNMTIGMVNPVLRGRMVSDYPLERRVLLNFLYNPSVITASHSIDLNAEGMLPTYARDPNDFSQYIVPLNSTISFDLLFDRTYELWDSAKRNSELYSRGVWVDILTFYKMVGMEDTAISRSSSTGSSAGLGEALGAMSLSPLGAAIGSAGGSTNTSGWPDLARQDTGAASGTGAAPATTPNSSPEGIGAMLPTNVQVQFGGPMALNYYGLVQSGNVQFTHFAANGAPSRATLSVSIQLMLRPTGSTNNLGLGPLNYEPPRAR